MPSTALPPVFVSAATAAALCDAGRHVDADQEAGTITYRLRDGTTFVDGGKRCATMMT